MRGELISKFILKFLYVFSVLGILIYGKISSRLDDIVTHQLFQSTNLYIGLLIVLLPGMFFYIAYSKEIKKEEKVLLGFLCFIFNIIAIPYVLFFLEKRDVKVKILDIVSILIFSFFMYLVYTLFLLDINVFKYITDITFIFGIALSIFVFYLVLQSARTKDISVNQKIVWFSLLFVCSGFFAPLFYEFVYRDYFINAVESAG